MGVSSLGGGNPLLSGVKFVTFVVCMLHRIRHCLGGRKAMDEEVARHNAVNVPVPRSLYMDCGYCKLGSAQG